MDAIAIDGPAGAGKSTVARRVAQQLGYRYIDTGAMYRALAWAALDQGIHLEDLKGLCCLARTAQIELVPSPTGDRVLLDGVDLTTAIRQPEVSQAVSHIAKIPQLRAELVRCQQEMAAKGRVVMDGRDIGTVVLPQARLKFFLTASLEERARRRALELREKGVEVDLAEVEASIALRDQIDSERASSPLRAAEDALLLDTTGRSIDEVVEEILSICRSSKGE